MEIHAVDTCILLLFYSLPHFQVGKIDAVCCGKNMYDIVLWHVQIFIQAKQLDWYMHYKE